MGSAEWDPPRHRDSADLRGNCGSVRGSSPSPAPRPARLLRLHPYCPGPSPDPDGLADYRTALEVYDTARTSPPSLVPELLERGRAALDRLEDAAVAGTDVSWTRGTGSATVRLPVPVDGGPALLLFRTDTPHRSFTVGLHGICSRVLLRGDGSGPVPARARVLVPGQRGGELPLDVLAVGPWRIAVRPASETRQPERGSR